MCVLPCGCAEGEECPRCAPWGHDPDAVPPDSTPSYLEIASQFA